jgi:lysophospholipase L1-like esterase
MLNNSNLNRSFRVFNLGVPGSNSSQHLKYFAQVLNKYQKPDFAIFLTGANDSWNFADSNILRFIDKKDTFDMLSIKLRLFFSQLRIYKMVKIIILNLKGRPPESDVDPFKLIRKYENIPEETLNELIEYNLVQIIKLSRSNDINLIFQNYPRGDVQGTLVQDVAKRFGVPFIDNFSAFNEQLKKVRFKDLFLYDISHPNPRGYTIMAEGIYKVIVERISK